MDVKFPRFAHPYLNFKLIFVIVIIMVLTLGNIRRPNSRIRIPALANDAPFGHIVRWCRSPSAWCTCWDRSRKRRCKREPPTLADSRTRTHPRSCNSAARRPTIVQYRSNHLTQIRNCRRTNLSESNRRYVCTYPTHKNVFKQHYELISYRLKGRLASIWTCNFKIAVRIAADRGIMVI